MGRKHRPLTCKEVKKVLKALGFTPSPSGGTSHQHWKAIVGGQMRKVTVDCPKQPFVDYLLKSMVRQSGYSIDEWYRQLDK